ncbi:Ig-like domain-containing protein [Aquimarina longa]|uniref:Ig-like domain-containing protein n=1 Tax=Aquimarina longa TaxID=1080221 RepID=UPI000786092D|nr:Ig-like domain-containing protein [Aquimarina longa]
MKELYILVALFIGIQTQASNDKYRLTLRDNPATSIVIGWNQVSGTNPIVHYGTIDQGKNYKEYTYSKSPDRIVSYRGMNNHFVRLSGLTPDTAYYFLIKDNEGVSKRFWFKTAPLENGKFSFIAGGDSRNNRVPRQKANRLVAKLKPHAVLFGGDMTADDNDSQWRTWFDDWQLTIAKDGRMFPILAARGNHEDSDDTITNLFDVPSTEAYYAITFGQDLVRTYTLNSLKAISGEQDDWLRGDLNKNQNVIWKMAQYHFPMFPHVSSKIDNYIEYENWAKLFYDNGVKLVIECDAHTVKSTWPIRPFTESGSEDGFIRDDKNGTVYIGEGGWGAPLRTNDAIKGWTRDSGKFNQFKWIFVDKNKIEARTIKVDNEPQVGEVSNDNVFKTPTNLDIWTPSNGSVIKIINKNLSAPQVSFETLKEGQQIPAGDTSIKVKATDSDGQIERVEFYIDGSIAGTDTTYPYSIIKNLSNGMHTIKIIAFDNHDICTEKIITVSVGNYTRKLIIPVAHGNDDVEEDFLGGLYTDSSDLELVYDTSNIFSFQKVGIRFQNIKIPQGATITSAHIQFTADESHHKRAELEFSLHNSDNSPPFSDENNVSGRNVVSPKIVWKPEPWNAGENTEKQKTPNLKKMIQQIINRAGWNLGNSMSFIIRGKGESLERSSYKRVAVSYDNNASKAAKLIVSYTLTKTLKTGEFEKHNSTDSFKKSDIYPNPFDHELTIEIPITKGTIHIQMHGINGNNVFSKQMQVKNNTIRIQPKNIDKGVYIITILDQNGVILTHKKVIKK